MSLDVALSLVNKLHSYLVQNISAAAILPSEFAEKQYASGSLTPTAMAFARDPCLGLGTPVRRPKFFSLGMKS